MITKFERKKQYLENVKERRVKEKMMIFGIRAVLEAIAAGKEFERILVRRDMSSALAKELTEALRGTNLPVQRVPQEKLNHLTQKNHQGVIAFLSEITYYKIEEILPPIFEQGRVPFLVVLDGVTDVRNFGAIARTCACGGVDALVIASRGSAAVNADAIKTSAGALHDLPVCRVESVPAALEFLASSGVKIVAANEKAERDFTDCDMTVPVALVMGAEETGIAAENLRLANEQVRIPMFGKIASLNVSVSAGVLIYEVIRQRR